MSSSTSTQYHCDNCGKKLPTCSNHVTIVTTKNEANIGWERLEVTIIRHHGSHNDGNRDSADLCQECAQKLFQDAANRVEAGERSSIGSESSRQEGFVK
jgi:hypothetical protein